MRAFARATSVALLLVVSAISMAGCGSDTPASNGKTFDQKNVSEVFALPQSEVEGSEVTGIVGLVGKVERDSEGVSLDFWTDPEKVKGHLIVDAGPEQVKEDDYIRVSGKVVDYYKGKSVAGDELELPRIKATTFEVVDATAMDPAVETIDVGETKSVAGVRISVVKAEISEKQTRIWVRYKNNSHQDFSELKSLTAHGEQVDEEYSDDYEAPSTTVSPGARTSGVLVYEAVKSGTRLILDLHRVRLALQAGQGEVQVWRRYRARDLTNLGALTRLRLA